MALIKDGAIVADDPWVTLGDEDALPESLPVVVTLGRWQAERDALMARNGLVGVLLSDTDDAADIALDLDRIGLIVLAFPTFKNGRSFSNARLLRERYGYTGEIRATGDILRDQILYMDRCGINAFDIKAPESMGDWDDIFGEQSVFYQPTGDGRPTALDQRT